MARTAPRRSVGSRIVTAIGVLMIVGGLSVLGWVGWQLWGTNVVSQRTQAAVVEDIERTWARGEDTVERAESTAGAILRVPRFGDDYAIPILAGTSDAVLSSGIGHFDDTAGPGQKGNFALAAHRITHGEPFRRMPELAPGDEVIVETRTKRFVYVLDTGGDDLTVDFTEGWVVDTVPKNPREGGLQPDQRPGQRLITLTTCAELFHTDDRLAAFGHLDRVEKKA